MANEVKESLSIANSKAYGSEPAENITMSGTSTQTGYGMNKQRNLVVPTSAGVVPLGNVTVPCRLALINTHLTASFLVDKAAAMTTWPQMVGPGEILKLNPQAGSTTVYWQTSTTLSTGTAQLIAIKE